MRSGSGARGYTRLVLQACKGWGWNGTMYSHDHGLASLSRGLGALLPNFLSPDVGRHVEPDHSPRRLLLDYFAGNWIASGYNPELEGSRGVNLCVGKQTSCAQVQSCDWLGLGSMVVCFG